MDARDSDRCPRQDSVGYVRWKPEDPLNPEKAETLETTREPDTSRLMLPSEVARLFGVDTRTVADWARAGKLRFRRTVGGQRRYPESEVRALIAELEAVA
jgi:excisionase family DNA binding protein